MSKLMDAPTARSAVAGTRHAALGRPQIILLSLLLVVTVFNYVDRTVISVLQEPIKLDLKLSDSQLGLLAGPAFAAFYAVSGVPVARIAERANRAVLLAATVAFWSVAMAFSGLASTFLVLALCRVGVGIGESGCVPMSHSLVADSFSLRRRGLAMSVLGSANSLATIIAPFAGGLVAARWGWRAAFVAVGAPGLLVALLVLLFLKDPRVVAGGDAGKAVGTKVWQDLGWLIRSPAFVFVFFTAACTGAAWYGINTFTVSFFARSYGFTIAAAATVLAFAGALGLAGTFISGWLADHFADARGRSYVLVPAIASLLSFATYFMAFHARTPALSVGFYLAAGFAYSFKNGPTVAAVQNIVPSHMRTTGSAIFMIGATVVGYLVGPLLAGLMSDHFAASVFSAAVGHFQQACPGGIAPPGAAIVVVGACRQAVASGLRHSLMILSSAFLISMLCYLAASVSIRVASPDGPVETPAG